jgi:hypothetical protein
LLEESESFGVSRKSCRRFGLRLMSGGEEVTSIFEAPPPRSAKSLAVDGDCLALSILLKKREGEFSLFPMSLSGL